MDEKNPHWEETKWSRKVYWKAGSPCGRDDDPDRVELSPSKYHYPSLDFAMPRQRHELDKVERLMESAYVRGRADHSVEVGKLFKDLISL